MDLDQILNNSSIRTALERIIQLSQGLSPDDQEALSKKLAQLPLTKSATQQKVKSTARSGKFFEKKKRSGKKADTEAPQQEPPEQEKSAPIESFERRVTGNQHFKQYLAKLGQMTDSVEKAKSVFKIVSAVPRQDDRFRQTLRRLLDR